MDGDWLNDKESRAWRGFVMVSQSLLTQLERDLTAAAGLSMADYAVLVNLSEVDTHRLRSTELAARMSWSRSRLSHQVARMESRGLIRRESCGDDARGSFIVLTDDGFNTIREAAPDHVTSVRKHLLSLLTDEQIDALGDITTAVIDHLAHIGAVPKECNGEAVTKAATPTALQS